MSHHSGHLTLETDRSLRSPDHLTSTSKRHENEWCPRSFVSSCTVRVSWLDPFNSPGPTQSCGHFAHVRQLSAPPCPSGANVFDALRFVPRELVLGAEWSHPSGEHAPSSRCRPRMSNYRFSPAITLQALLPTRTPASGPQQQLVRLCSGRWIRVEQRTKRWSP